MTPAEKVFPAQKVEEFCVNVLTKAGLSPELVGHCRRVAAMRRGARNLFPRGGKARKLHPTG